MFGIGKFFFFQSWQLFDSNDEICVIRFNCDLVLTQGIDPSGGQSLSLDHHLRPFYPPSYCVCVFEILNRRMGREKRRTETCDLSAKFFLLPPQQNPKKSLSLSEIFGRGNENKNDGLPPASWRHNQFGTKKKNYKQNKKERCVSSQQLMNNFRLGRGWWTICHLPGDNSGLNTKKELGKCFLINLGRWSSFVGSWGQKAVFGFWNSLNGQGERKKKHLPTSDSSTSLPHERKTNETKRPCDIVPNSLCYVNVRCIKIELCGYVVLSLIGVRVAGRTCRPLLLQLALKVTG